MVKRGQVRHDTALPALKLALRRPGVTADYVMAEDLECGALAQVGERVDWGKGMVSE